MPVEPTTCRLSHRVQGLIGCLVRMTEFGVIGRIVACVRALPFATVFNPGELSVTFAYNMELRE